MLRNMCWDVAAIESTDTIFEIREKFALASDLLWHGHISGRKLDKGVVNFS